jgi:CelD/BcsL family acetyltransferase involved in cellulose biosynthesis
VGNVSFHIHDGREDLDRLLADGYRVEAPGWKGEQGSDIMSRAAHRQFYTDISRWAAQRGWLRLAFLRIDGRAIAFDLCLEREREHYLLKTGYDPSFRQYAPGMLLRRDMLQRSFEERLTRYDFLGTDMPWKLEWTQDTTTRSLVQAFSPSLHGRIDRSIYETGRPLALRLRERSRSAG